MENTRTGSEGRRRQWGALEKTEAHARRRKGGPSANRISLPDEAGGADEGPKEPRSQ
jgi:hypothetical protein